MGIACAEGSREAPGMCPEPSLGGTRFAGRPCGFRGPRRAAGLGSGDLLRHEPLRRLQRRTGSLIPNHTRCSARSARHGAQVCRRRNAKPLPIQASPFLISAPPAIKRIPFARLSVNSVPRTGAGARSECVRHWPLKLKSLPARRRLPATPARASSLPCARWHSRRLP